MIIYRDLLLNKVTDFKKNVVPKLDENKIAVELYGDKINVVIGWEIKDLEVK